MAVMLHYSLTCTSTEIFENKITERCLLLELQTWTLPRFGARASPYSTIYQIKDDTRELPSFILLSLQNFTSIAPKAAEI